MKLQPRSQQAAATLASKRDQFAKGADEFSIAFWNIQSAINFERSSIDLPNAVKKMYRRDADVVALIEWPGPERGNPIKAQTASALGGAQWEHVVPPSPTTLNGATDVKNGFALVGRKGSTKFGPLPGGNDWLACEIVPDGWRKSLLLYVAHLRDPHRDIAVLVADMASQAKKGRHVVCVGDFNLPPASLAFPDLDVTWTAEPTYWNRGSGKRSTIDYAISSRDIVPRVVAADPLYFDCRTSTGQLYSDHCPMWCYLREC